MKTKQIEWHSISCLNFRNIYLFFCMTSSSLYLSTLQGWSGSSEQAHCFLPTLALSRPDILNTGSRPQQLKLSAERINRQQTDCSSRFGRATTSCQRPHLTLEPHADSCDIYIVSLQVALSCHSLVIHLFPRISNPPRPWSLLSPPLSALA